jgi:hypothetical protein
MDPVIKILVISGVLFVAVLFIIASSINVVPKQHKSKKGAEGTI